MFDGPDGKQDLLEQIQFLTERLQEGGNLNPETLDLDILARVLLSGVESFRHARRKGELLNIHPAVFVGFISTLSKFMDNGGRVIFQAPVKKGNG